MNIIRLSVALITLSVAVFSADAQVARMSDIRAKQGISAPVDKQHKGSLFGSFAFFKGVIPDDVYSLEDVGPRCNESGAPDERSPARCKRYVSDRENTTFLIRFARDKHLTFYYKTVNGRQVLVPYTVYDNNTYQMSYVSGEAQQFASAHGLSGSTGVAVASTSLPGVTGANVQYCASLPPADRIKCRQETSPQPARVEVASAGSKCDKLPALLKGACERTLSADQTAGVKVGPVIGGIVDAAKR